MAGILGRADSLVVSNMYGETTHPQLPTLTVRSACQATACTFRETQSGASLTVRLRDLELAEVAGVFEHSNIVGTFGARRP